MKAQLAATGTETNILGHKRLKLFRSISITAFSETVYQLLYFQMTQNSWINYTNQIDCRIVFDLTDWNSFEFNSVDG